MRNLICLNRRLPARLGIWLIELPLLLAQHTTVLSIKSILALVTCLRSQRRRDHRFSLRYWG